MLVGNEIKAYNQVMRLANKMGGRVSGEAMLCAADDFNLDGDDFEKKAVAHLKSKYNVAPPYFSEGGGTIHQVISKK